MSEIAATIRHMRAKGIDCSLILDAIEAMAEAASIAKDDALEERRANDRARHARWRAAQKEKAKANVSHADKRDETLEEPLPPCSPLLPSPKPLTNNPPIIPPTLENPAPAKAKRETNGSRLAADWTLPRDWGEEARLIAFKAKQPISDDEIENEADKFRDYWTAKPGAAGRKLDWRGTWRNWFRSYLDRRPKPRNAPSGYGPAAVSQHGGGTIEDVVARRALQRRNGNGVSDERGRGHDIPATPDLLEGEYRLVG